MPRKRTLRQTIQKALPAAHRILQDGFDNDDQGTGDNVGVCTQVGEFAESVGLDGFGNRVHKAIEELQIVGAANDRLFDDINFAIADAKVAAFYVGVAYGLLLNPTAFLLDAHGKANKGAVSKGRAK